MLNSSLQMQLGWADHALIRIEIERQALETAHQKETPAWRF